MIWFVKCLTIGAAGGFVGGLLGVGGGILMVPLGMALLGLGIKDAKAISLAIIVVVSIAGTLSNQTRLAGHWGAIVAAGVAAAVFSWLGVRLGETMDRRLLLRIFAVLLIFVGGKYLWQTSRPDAAPAAGALAETPVDAPR